MGYWDKLYYYPSHRRKKAASCWYTNACGSFCIPKVAPKMHRFYLPLPKNPYLRGFQWVFPPFLQVLNEWIFTAFHRSSHRSFRSDSIFMFQSPCVERHLIATHHFQLKCLCHVRIFSKNRQFHAAIQTYQCVLGVSRMQMLGKREFVELIHKNEYS